MGLWTSVTATWPSVRDIFPYVSSHHSFFSHFYLCRFFLVFSIPQRFSFKISFFFLFLPERFKLRSTSIHVLVYDPFFNLYELRSVRNFGS